MHTRPLYLASSSPRRKELLAQLGYAFTIITPDVEELLQPEEMPRDYVLRLSRQKAQAGATMLQEHEPDAVVIGADTIVVCGETVLEKPYNREHARQMLRTLSANRHQVMTAVTVADQRQYQSELVVTDVWFRALSEEEINRYWESGEPCDKAGAYGIQGTGGRFVSRIEGSYHAVVGLPLLETEQLLLAFLTSY
ncbi:septum formation inhibitor Maf [Vibrio sp. HA2012]|uniref:Maf family protein n=1 Tax=Vibrio sp. HA2012 TaxID=1971595 RepID=UPI000C2CCCBE|nr:Maf family protein [Vibrio sp. HA2012]PJC85551.1 septum formation inhibitor Maf [Vibrio sp. HA2012]